MLDSKKTLDSVPKREKKDLIKLFSMNCIQRTLGQRPFFICVSLEIRMHSLSN